MRRASVVAASALAACAAASALGCAETSTGSRGGSAANARGAADDGDLWNLVPAATDAVADVDLAALRASPWSRPLVTGDLGGEREARRQAFGFDVFTEADRMIVIGHDADGASHTLTLARGRFDADRIGAAFLAASPGASAGRWRESPFWEGGGRAVALVTPRTLAQGEPGAVRAAVDAAWGIVPDARGGPLGELRRSLDADRSPPALFFAAAVTDAMRARAAGTLDIPPALHRIGGRLDLGEDLDLDGSALFDDGHAARAAASTWGAAARLVARQPMVALLGLGPVIDALALTAEGTRVHARLHVAADKRESLAEKVNMVLGLVAKARSAPGP
jgi:hypothetical protein